MVSEPLVKNIFEIERILYNINWDFYPKSLSSKKNLKLFNCRKYHWYPATFIPEIPYTLIELLTKPGAKVFDPFFGIGTSYFQALLLNRLPFGTDICSFAIEFSSLLFKLFNPNIDLLRINTTIKNKAEKYESDINYCVLINEIDSNQYLKELGRWYTKENFNALCFLIILERNTKNKFANAALRLSISSILSTVSNQDRGWGCIADNVLPKSHQVKQINVINFFIRKLTKLMTDLNLVKSKTNYKEVYKETEKNKTVFSSIESASKELNENSIDFVITSPPYPNMVDYITSQRLSYYYFGYDINIDKKDEIGARYKRRRRSALENYLLEMEKTNKNISKTIKKGGLLCYIMPSFNTKNENNVRRKSIVQNLISGLERFGLTKEIELRRSIPSLKRSHNKKWATLDNEIIYIFKKI